jgi:hypothetical protein
MVAIVLAAAVLEKFGGDTMADLSSAWQAYQQRLRTSLTPGRD